MAISNSKVNESEKGQLDLKMKSFTNISGNSSVCVHACGEDKVVRLAM